MNHKMGFNPLSRTPAHRRAMSRNMVTSLFRFERITTTQSKAKEVRRSAEKLITRAKEDSVHNRREAAKFISDEKILNKLAGKITEKEMTEMNYKVDIEGKSAYDVAKEYLQKEGLIKK